MKPSEYLRSKTSEENYRYIWGTKEEIPKEMDKRFIDIEELKKERQKTAQEIIDYIDKEIEIVKSRPTKGLPILKMESFGTLERLKKKLKKKYGVEE